MRMASRGSEPRAAASGQRTGLIRGARQGLEEGRKSVRIEAHAGRKLPQDGAELFPEFEQAGGKEVGERLLHGLSAYQRA